ncbi:MAG TPA: outer membrane beta-barrel protein, partial [Chthoniobacterales bacterium]
MMIRKILAIAAAFVAASILAGPFNLRAQEEDPDVAPTETSGTQAAANSGPEAPMNDYGQQITPEESSAGAELGIGKFAPSRFHFSFQVSEGYDDNVYDSTFNPITSFFTSGSVVLDYNFSSPRTSIDFRGVAGGTYYYNRPFGQEYDVNDSITLGITHHLTPRLTLSAAIYLSYQTEPDFTDTFGVNRLAGNYFYTSDKFSAAYQWAPRFSTVTSYTFDAINYDSAVVSTYEDRTEHTFGNEFRFLASPTTALVGEYRFQLVDYSQETRNSTTHFFLAGFDHTFSPDFNVSLRAGVEARFFEDFGERTGPYGEATLRYAPGHRTSISWTSRYGLEEPDVPGTQSRTTFRTGLSASYGIAPRTTISGSVSYEHDANQEVLQPPFF